MQPVYITIELWRTRDPLVPRPTITAGYVLDPDGNNIEAVCHKPA